MIENIKLTRKPKYIHGIKTTGINFGLSYHVMDGCTTPEEIEDFKKIRIQLDNLSLYYSEAPNRHMLEGTLNYYRKLWRMRYSESFDDGIYIVSKKVGSYNWKSAGKIGGHNIWRAPTAPKKGDLLIWTRRDALGSNYFMLNNSRGLEDGMEIMVERTSSLVDSIMKLDL